MKKYIFWGLFVFLAFSVGMIYPQLPANFNNQQMLINRIEVNVALIKHLTQNIIDNPVDNPQMRSDLVSSVIKKDACADEISEILCKEFLQKYILSSDPELDIKLAIVHKILNICFLLKTSVDIEFVKTVESEITKFKDHLKLNYQMDPEYKPSRYRKYKPQRKY